MGHTAPAAQLQQPCPQPLPCLTPAGPSTTTPIFSHWNALASHEYAATSPAGGSTSGKHCVHVGVELGRENVRYTALRKGKYGRYSHTCMGNKRGLHA